MAVSHFGMQNTADAFSEATRCFRAFPTKDTGGQAQRCSPSQFWASASMPSGFKLIANSRLAGPCSVIGHIERIEDRGATGFQRHRRLPAQGKYLAATAGVLLGQRQADAPVGAGDEYGFIHNL